MSTTRAILSFLVMSAIVILAGCGGDTSASSKRAGDAGKAAETKKAEADQPPLPGEDEEQDEGTTEILIRNPGSKRAAREGYAQADGMASGSLRGVCVTTFPKGKKVVAPKRVAWTFKGDQAIRNPMKGEVEYYKNMGIKRLEKPWYLGSRARKDGRWSVGGAVLMVKGITHGPRAPLARPGYMFRHAKIKPQASISGMDAWVFGSPEDKFFAFTYDAYPNEIVLKETGSGKVVYEGKVSAYSRNGAKPLAGGGTHFARPQPTQSSVIEKPGFYEMSCKRHPWVSGRLIVVENPYAAIASNSSGSFSISSLPVGKHAVEIWHPVFTPKKRTLEIEIKANEPTELFVEFETPEL